MSYAKIHAGYLNLGSGALTTIEVDISFGLHSFSIVGLGDKAVDEAKDRIGAAIKNSGYTSPKQKNHKVVISLSPADIKKEGSYFDLGMALGYLHASNEVNFDTNKKIFIGEVRLDGRIVSVKGILPILNFARSQGYTEAYIPQENSKEAGLLDGLRIYAAANLREIIEHLEQRVRLQPLSATHIDVQRKFHYDISNLHGLSQAKRALQIAAVGFHSIGLYGPPGTGKTSLIKVLSEILPAPTREEIVEINSLHSAAGSLSSVITNRPFRTPHHSSSYTAILGGGSHPRPGEITLAHQGLLFLDEFPHFDRRVIDGLREPLEEKIVRIARSKETLTFPADVLLAVALNPCPCGKFGSLNEKCHCASHDIRTYQKKISGPIIDRIHMWVHIPTTKPTIELSHHESKDMTSEILAHNIQKAFNFRKTTQIRFTKEAADTLSASVSMYHLSPRTYKKISSISKTIAAIEHSTSITKEHVLEALTYRPKGIGGT